MTSMLHLSIAVELVEEESQDVNTVGLMHRYPMQ